MNKQVIITVNCKVWKVTNWNIGAEIKLDVVCYLCLCYFGRSTKHMPKWFESPNEKDQRAVGLVNDGKACIEGPAMPRLCPIALKSTHSVELALTCHGRSRSGSDSSICDSILNRLLSFSDSFSPPLNRRRWLAGAPQEVKHENKRNAWTTWS